IISDVLDLSGATSAPTPDRSASAFQVSLGWTASTPGRTAEAIFRLDAAATAADVAAAAALFDVPAQNIVFATTDGH
ncbi:penicillin acylase family protein, partial [Listeria monocytogenes]|nr:penicillin acylase family protein [Listeria monocytogenes]